MAIEINKDAALRAAKPKEKEYLINDGGNLYLLVLPTGGKVWRFIYSFGDKRKKITLGNYPNITLAEARNKAKDYREDVAQGIDPALERQQEKQISQQEKQNIERKKSGLPLDGSFADVATQWLNTVEHLTKPQTHVKKANRLKTYAFPVIGDVIINELKSSEIMALLKPLIDKRQLETAHRLHNEISSVFDWAIVQDHINCEYNPSQPVKKQLPAQKVKHRAAIIDPKQVGQLMRDIHNYQGTFVVQQALKLSPLLFQRPKEIRTMLWRDIDLIAKEWRPFVTKTDFHHIVPLATQAIQILEAVQPLTGHQEYVFPSSRGNGRPMSDGTIITALKAMGYDSDTMTAHGFRSTASTLLNERGWSADAIERQLAHAPRDAVRAAYNRAQYLDERRRMMQSWADYLDSLRAGATVLPFKSKTG
jgi:integrase